MSAAGAPTKRSLILAGGGLKVAFQAGVLQVWLDETGIPFDHADGASGGTFNLALWCQGRSGREIADAWRRFRPLRGFALNWRSLWKLFWTDSLCTYDRFRRNVLRADWGLDWERIRASQRVGTFNVYNFSRHELEVVGQDRMDEDLLVACVSLPGWFPPVQVDGDRLIDSVYVSDANLAEAIRRGADELWIVWTVSDEREWSSGPIDCYFQIIESAANGQFRDMLRRIARNNLLEADGKQGEFGRHIEVKLLKAEVPVHYLLTFSRQRIAAAVELGVHAARAWCRERGIATREPAPEAAVRPVALDFSEVMRGFVAKGETDVLVGAQRGRERDGALVVRLDIAIDDVECFVTHPEHEAVVRGRVECPLFGDPSPVEEGSTFNLFTWEQDPAKKRMHYRLFFREASGADLTLSGWKVVEDDPGLDVWADTTTLYTRIYRGRVAADAEAGAEVVASGVLRVHLPDFLRQLTSFRARGPSSADEARALLDFLRFFLGSLWDVYARGVLAPAPL
jgi:predicted acylesterase/phospholipase RssA